MGFIDDIEVFSNMLDDYTLTEEDYYNKFAEICDRYNEHSIEPYNLFCYLLYYQNKQSNNQYLSIIY